MSEETKLPPEIEKHLARPRLSASMLRPAIAAALARERERADRAERDLAEANARLTMYGDPEDDKLIARLEREEAARARVEEALRGLIDIEESDPCGCGEPDCIYEAALAAARAALAGEPAPAGECTTCGGPVHHRPGKPGEYDHACAAPAAPEPPPKR